MDRKTKDTPPRLPVVFRSYDPPLYLVTFNTLLRRPLLACDAVHVAFREYAERGLSFHVSTGRYVLMPDHVHVFVRIGRDMTLRRWESGLKQRLGKTLTQVGHMPARIPCSVEPAVDTSSRRLNVTLSWKASGSREFSTTFYDMMKAIRRNGITSGAIPSAQAWLRSRQTGRIKVKFMS